MYETNTNEYLVTIVDDAGQHRLSLDDEDMARLMNDGVEILTEEPCPERPPDPPEVNP